MTLAPESVSQWRRRIGSRGVWCHTDHLDATAAATFAAELESLGYGALWLPDTLGRDSFAHIAHLIDHTRTLVFATGIAGIYSRLPGPMLQAANTVAEQSEGRFVLGLGVSHQAFVEGMRGVTYERPLAAMRSYLERLDASMFLAVGPPEAPPRLLAALGPKMLGLAAELADGAHTYWATPEHTAGARDLLGADKLICVEQKVVLTDDTAVARATASASLALYADLPNYRNNWKRLGFTDDEIDARAPRFVDTLVAWGPPDAIQARVEEHLAAGADHVCIQPLGIDNAFEVDQEALRVLAPR